LKKIVYSRRTVDDRAPDMRRNRIVCGWVSILAVM